MKTMKTMTMKTARTGVHALGAGMARRRRVWRLRGAVAVTDETLRMGLILLGVAIVVLMASMLWGQWQEIELKTALRDVIGAVRSMDRMRGGHGEDVLTGAVIARGRIPSHFIDRDKKTIVHPFGGEIAVAGKGRTFEVTVDGLDEARCQAVGEAFLSERDATLDHATIGGSAVDVPASAAELEKKCGADGATVVLGYR